MSLTNSNWVNRNEGAPNTQRNPVMGLHHVQKVPDFPYENPWFQQQQQQHEHQHQQQQQQQPDMDARRPPIYSQQDQQTYWNNNMTQKYPPVSLPKTTYQNVPNTSWNQQPQYVQKQQPQLMQMQQQNQQPPPPQMQQQFSGSSNIYSFVEDPSNNRAVYNPPQQQMNYGNSNPGGGGDPWNWGWDDSSNNSPATSFTANNNFKNDSTWNWNVDDTQDQTTADAKPAYNPAQDYFTSENSQVPVSQSIPDGNVAQIEQLMNDINIQPKSVRGQRNFSANMESAFYENQEQPHPDTIIIPPKPEPSPETCSKREATENLATVNLTTVDSAEPVFDAKSGGTPSLDSGSTVGVSEIKMERLSPTSGQNFDVPESIVKSDCPPTFPSGPASTGSEFKTERISPETGRMDGGSENNGAADALIPPPGLDRMVLGQLTENENDGPGVPEVSAHHHHGRHIHLHQSTPPLGLHRLVVGQLTDDQTQNSGQENQNMSSLATTDDIPLPDFHRMVPGESSSPETQNVMQLSMDSLPREQRVVTGVARDEIDVVGLQSNLPTASPATPVNRLSAQPPNSEESRVQFQSERCETIGSDNVDNYAANSGDNSPVKQSKRKDNKDRDRHLDDITSDEGERDQGRRREKDSGYYSQRGPVNRERDESPHRDRQRYRDRRTKGRDLLDWERDRRSESPARYRDDKERRRDYRDDRRRHLDQYYSDDDDADTNGYYSDRDQRNMSGYGDEYDRAYSRREDRARSLRPEKIARDRNDERGSGNDRRRGDYIDRERERERNRERDRDRQSDYYRRRGHDEMGDYGDNQRSRPSSRNDSVHDYKHRGRTDYEEERDRGDRIDRYRGPPKRDREMFFPGYGYDPAYYNYYYQYCENLRRTNPAAYAEWCRKYYAQSQHGTFDGSYTEDRGSVHSGRSSANDENKERYTQKDPVCPYGSPQAYPCYQTLDQSYPYHSYSSDLGERGNRRRIDLQMEKNNTASQRLTPAKFSTAHAKGILTPRGQLLKISAHYPLDGQPATLEIHDQLSCYDDMRKELQDFPGPLVRGVTHKNNILKYCKQKIKEAEMNPSIFDKDSYKLIWELLILLIRQNGTVVGTDIAELLMYDRTAHMSIHQSSGTCPANSENSQRPGLSEEEVTNQFRDYLIYGNTREALEWAMKHGLWGHALFLASKMDQRTYASVMTRFANGLTMNDPLQTLYQLMSGRQPASVTCCADEKWGDWRPHLAMILSNSTARPDLDVKTVTTLGDTLGSRGNLHAAHFCYLMAQVEFGMYSQKSSKIVLIGSSHTLPFSQFCTNEAIFATEIFEFACSLADPEFTLHHLQVYKLLIARRLMEVGLVQEAVHYAELIANTITKHPSNYSPQFIQEVYDVGSMLKYSDPVYSNSESVESSNTDPEWLSRLLSVLNDYQMGVLQHDGFGSASNLTTYSENDAVQSLTLDTTTSEPVNDNQLWQSQQQPPLPQQPRLYEQKIIQHQQNDASLNGYTHVVHNEAPAYKDQPIITGPSLDDSSQNYWTNANHWVPPQRQAQQQQPPQLQETRTVHEGGVNDYKSPSSVDITDHSQQPIYDYFETNRNEGSKPKITLPNARQRTTSDSSDNQKKAPKLRPAAAAKETSKSSQSGSWFGGIFNKLPFRPKNQMILPDDKNPSIVWDSARNQWVNLDGDDSDAGGSPPPPPKSSDLPTASPQSSFVAVTPVNLAAEEIPRSQQQQQQQQQYHPTPDPTSNIPLSGGQNKYKMNRGKSFKSNYVDVMNPGGAAKSNTSTLPAPDLFPGYSYSPQLPSSYMIPAPVEGNENAPTDFLTPSSGPIIDNAEPSQSQALSRWSSTSSLSREVQKYTSKQIRTAKSPGGGGDEYQISNSQWNGGITNPQRLPANLPRSKGYMK